MHYAGNRLCTGNCRRYSIQSWPSSGTVAHQVLLLAASFLADGCVCCSFAFRLSGDDHPSAPVVVGVVLLHHVGPAVVWLGTWCLPTSCQCYFGNPLPQYHQYVADTSRFCRHVCANGHQRLDGGAVRLRYFLPCQRPFSSCLSSRCFSATSRKKIYRTWMIWE